jgi:carbamoyltransferase
MRCLGLSGGYKHDAAACLVEDGTVVAYVEEERLTRQRHGVGSGPRRCIEWVLDKAVLDIEDVDAIALSWNSRFTEDVEELPADTDEYKELFADSFAGRSLPPVYYVDHHLSHAASAYRTSTSNSCIVLTLDGYGDGRSAVVYRGNGDELTELANAGLQHSWGWLYQMITEYVGLGSWQHAGKTMALAALGKPRFASVFVEFLTFGGGFPTPEKVGLAEFVHDNKRLGRLYYEEAEAWLRSRLEAVNVTPTRVSHRYDRLTGNRVHADVTPTAADVASSLQETFEEYLFQLTRRHLEAESMNALCIAGGVALNCKAVGEMLRRIPQIEQLYVPPVAADMGGALGAALEVLHRLGDSRRPDITDIRLGPGYSEADINQVLDSIGISFKRCSDIARDAAELICRGKIVAWFQGRSEVGPRALGARSIIALPDSRQRAKHINFHIKNRETWRPFSPSVLPGSFMTSRWDRAELASPHMAVALHTHERDGLDGVVHEDTTSRVQKVMYPPEDPYHRLLREVEDRTGVPAVLNTSLNGRNEPIVMRPPEALRLLYTTPLDALAIGPFLVTK